MNAVEERRSAMPNNPYMFNGSRTGPRTIGGKRRRTSHKRSRSRSRSRSRKNIHTKK